MQIKTLSLVLAFCFVGNVKPALACVCSNPNLSDREGAAAQFQVAAAVFEGEVLPGGQEITAWNGKPSLSMIRFRVIRSYKGPRGEILEVYDAYARTDCGFGQPRPGTKFFVYGFQGEDGKLFISACSRTTSLDDAGPDIRFARDDPPTKEDLAPSDEKWRLYKDQILAERGASLVGKATRDDGADVSNAWITLWDVDENGVRHRAGTIVAQQKVTADGSFKIRFLAPGRYNVTAADLHASPTARFVGEYGTVALEEHQVLPHLTINLHAEPLGSVRVRVVAPQEIRDRVFVLLRDVKMDSFDISPYPYSQTADLDDENTASFEFVPYGRYKVYAMLTGENSGGSWTHDEVQFQLNGNHMEAVVKLRKAQENDH